MFKFTLGSVAVATGGRILSGSPELELTGFSTDTQTVRPGELFFALRGKRFDAHDFLHKLIAPAAGAAVIDRAQAADRAPGLPLVLVKDTAAALGALARWHRRRCPTTLIAVTGSNGKTTTKEMLFHVLSGVVPVVRSAGNHNNAVGVPLTLFALRPEHVYAVVEMGTNSPGEIAALCETAEPDIGLVTNIAAAHLQGLGSIEGVAREKGALLKHTARRGGAFYNADDYWSRQVAKSLKGTLRSFGLENEASVRAFSLLSDPSGLSFKIVRGPRIHLPVRGTHNAANALAAIAVARKLGIDWDTIGQRLATFKLPARRMEADTVAGVTIIDDAYNANPVSMEAAAATLGHLDCAGRRVMVVADMLELGGRSVELHRAAGREIAHFAPDYLLGLGQHTAALIDSAVCHGMKREDACLASSPADLAGKLLNMVQPGDAVLFKGSRGMRMENVIELVKQGLTARAGLAPEAAACDPARIELDETAAVPQSAPATGLVG